MKIKCKRCEKEWEYKGKSKYYASCPNCKTSVKIELKGGIRRNE